MTLREKLWLLLSQAVNSLCFAGEPDESLCARAYRERVLDDGLRQDRIDRWLGKGHCQRVWEAQRKREQDRSLAIL